MLVRPDANMTGTYTSTIPGHVNYRSIFEGLPADSYSLTIAYEFTKGGNIAFDFLTTNYGVTLANICDDLPSGVDSGDCIALVNAGPPSNFTFPDENESVNMSILGGGTVKDRQVAHNVTFAGFAPGVMKIYGVRRGD